MSELAAIYQATQPSDSCPDSYAAVSWWCAERGRKADAFSCAAGPGYVEGLSHDHGPVGELSSVVRHS